MDSFPFRNHFRMMNVDGNWNEYPSDGVFWGVFGQTDSSTLAAARPSDRANNHKYVQMYIRMTVYRI